MNWLFDHFQIVAIVGIVIASWIKKRSDAQREEVETRRAIEELADEDSDWHRPPPVVPTPRHSASPSIPPTRPGRIPPPLAQRTLVTPPPVQSAPALQDELLQRQIAMQEQLVEIKKEKAAAKLTPPPGARETQQRTMGSTSSPVTSGMSLKETLKRGDASRRAFILSEILGPPLSLK